MSDYRIDNPMTDSRFDPKPKPVAEIPARKMHVLIEIDPPNVDDVAGESVAEIEAAMEQRTSHRLIQRRIELGRFLVVSKLAVEVVRR